MPLAEGFFKVELIFGLTGFQLFIGFILFNAAVFYITQYLLPEKWR
jgi:hypothetical protein